MRILGKSFLVKLYSLIHYLECGLSVLEPIYFDFLVLEFLVVFEEPMDLFQNMLRQLTDIIIVCHGHVLESNSNNLIILFILINHPHNSNDLSLYQTQCLNLDTTYDQYIQRILIITIRPGNEAIISRIMNSTKQYPIHLQ